ncbi:hypothetical protein BDY19DRAFT_934477 [Irpex rosettiformis]|uniref:Uncharacterized protein n=1 Tax=Irpex rosettiformis TaxID=378272 RepID=A0ACB8UAK7_9APHY|nr:hypothetical protein BDY19DRAFT_934477 [Irpex rosettiformis]
MAATYSAFFYGTLLHPFILRRVIDHPGNDLEICPALLLEHTRHAIKLADYPGVIPYYKTRQLLEKNGLNPDLPPEERTVRGTLVKGLSKNDVALLDIFEGNEYSRDRISVHPLGPLVPLSSISPAASSEIAPSDPPPIPSLDTIATTHPPVQAHTYIWINPLEDLKPEIWYFADFVQKNAWKWVGDGKAVEENEFYGEVDKRRDMGGVIVREEIADAAGTEGKDIRVVVGVEA